MAEADGPPRPYGLTPDDLPTVKNSYLVLNKRRLKVPPVMLAFVLMQAAAVVLLRCAPYAMLAILFVAFIIAGPLDHD